MPEAFGERLSDDALSALVERSASTFRHTRPAAGERLGYDRWLKANTVKTRTHSPFRRGLMLCHHLPNWPEHRLHPLVEKLPIYLWSSVCIVKSSG